MTAETTKPGPMVKLRFKATPKFAEYHDRPHNWTDGDKRQVPQSTAEALLRDYPKNFFKAR